MGGKRAMQRDILSRKKHKETGAGNPGVYLEVKNNSIWLASRAKYYSGFRQRS